MDQKQFVSELAKLRPASTFLSVMGYRTSNSEVADYSLVFHMSYENALKRSILALQAADVEGSLQMRAKQELLDGYQKSLEKLSKTPIEAIDDAYTRFFDENGSYIKGVKLHTETNVLHLYGLVNHKRVIMPGLFATRNKQELTVAKDRLRKLCPVNKFRQFIMTPNHVNYISVENMTLLPPSA